MKSTKNLARYDQKQVESTANSQDVAGPAEVTQYTRQAEDTMTPTEEAYVNPDSNKKSSLFQDD